MQLHKKGRGIPPAFWFGMRTCPQLELLLNVWLNEIEFNRRSGCHFYHKENFMKRYIASVAYNGYASVRHVFLSKTAFDNFVEKAKNNENCSYLSTEEQNSDAIYETLKPGNQFISFHTEGCVKLPDVCVHAVRNSYERAYTLSQFANEATRQIEKINKAAQSIADRHFSKPWV